MRLVNLTLFSILLSIKAMGMPNGWKLARDSNDIKVWLSKSNSNITASLEVSKKSRSLDWSKVNESSFFKKLEKKKRMVLSIIGITNWKADNYKWNKKKQELYLDGHYTDSSQRRIFFVEYHYYKKEESIQILHTRPAGLKNGENYQQEILSYLKSKVLSK